MCEKVCYGLFHNKIFLSFAFVLITILRVLDISSLMPYQKLHHGEWNNNARHVNFYERGTLNKSNRIHFQNGAQPAGMFHFQNSQSVPNSSIIFVLRNTSTSSRGAESYQEWTDPLDDKVHRVSCEEEPDYSSKWDILLWAFKRGGVYPNMTEGRFNALQTRESRLAGTPPSVENYLCRILVMCAKEDLALQVTNYTEHPVCPCIPANLRGNLILNVGQLMDTPWDALTNAYPGVDKGGHWAPRSCVARRRVSVIVPFRDRERHLRAFLAHIHHILQRQLVEYRIFIVEQNLPYMFNKAAVMNAGYLEAKKLFDADCVLFHDVDTLTERDDNMAVCGHQPVHWCGYVDKFGYRSQFNLFGAAVLLSTHTFERVNGFTNLFFGWGAEDDILRRRIIQKRTRIYRLPLSVGRCKSMEHDRDPLFLANEHDSVRKTRLFMEMMVDPVWQEVDGLNTSRYDVINFREFPTHTWIRINLKPPAVKDTAPDIYKKWASEMATHGFREDPRSYFNKNICPTKSIRNGTRLFLSRVSCKFACDKDPSCVEFEYHVCSKHAHDSFCILRGLADCENKTALSNETELHVKQIVVETQVGNFDQVNGSTVPH